MYLRLPYVGQHSLQAPPACPPARHAMRPRTVHRMCSPCFRSFAMSGVCNATLPTALARHAPTARPALDESCTERAVNEQWNSGRPRQNGGAGSGSN
jgi:hypothetical protein